MLESLQEIIKGFSLSGVNFILVKDDYLFKQIRGVEYTPKGEDEMYIIRTDSFEDVKTFNDKDMAELGWVRKDKDIDIEELEK
tara:strand:+ start:3895 stop:4143 length:249 start_codon:yes stop_codon:yes gene_type:complete